MKRFAATVITFLISAFVSIGGMIVWLESYRNAMLARYAHGNETIVAVERGVLSVHRILWLGWASDPPHYGLICLRREAVEDQRLSKPADGERKIDVLGIRWIRQSPRWTPEMVQNRASEQARQLDQVETIVIAEDVGQGPRPTGYSGMSHVRIERILTAPGWYLGIPCWLILLGSGLFATRSGWALGKAAVRTRRQKLGRCVCCGYDLRMTSGPCPECGKPRIGLN